MHAVKQGVALCEGAAERVEEAHDGTLGLVRVDGGVAGDTPTCAELELVDPADVLHEAFLVDPPTEGDGGEGGPLVAFGQLGGTVPTDGSGNHVAVVIGVVDTGHVGLHLLLGHAGAEGAEGADAAHVVPQGFLDRKVLGVHVHGAAVVGVGGVQEGDAEAVLADLAVVVEQLRHCGGHASRY